MAYIITAVTALIAYLLLTAGSWSREELLAGALLSVVVAVITAGFYFRDNQLKRNPVRVLLFFFYLIGPFFLEMAKANIEVAVRVITGKIRPGLIRYRPQTKSDFGTMLIANSITLTPGTLTVSLDQESNDLYVHVLAVKPGQENKPVWQGKDLFGLFNLSAWIRRIAE